MRAILGATLALTLLAISFAIDFTQTTRNGAVDLRNRITGVRLLEHGIDPYHYIWHPGDPAEFCDLRNNPRMTVSKTTATPAMLVFYAPLAAMPYRAAQFAWLYAQWLLLLGTGWLWLRVSTTPLQRWLVIFFLVGFTFTPGWRWEAERGQFYTLLTFLFALWLSVTREAGRATIAGFLAGLLIALRPPFAMLLPFIALVAARAIAGSARGIDRGNRRADASSRASVGLARICLGHADQRRLLSAREFAAAPGPQAFPEVIEGDAFRASRQHGVLLPHRRRYDLCARAAPGIRLPAQRPCHSRFRCSLFVLGVVAGGALRPRNGCPGSPLGCSSPTSFCPRRAGAITTSAFSTLRSRSSS